MIASNKHRDHCKLSWGEDGGHEAREDVQEQDDAKGIHAAEHQKEGNGTGEIRHDQHQTLIEAVNPDARNWGERYCRDEEAQKEEAERRR